jgi:hypothetical protein
MRALDRYDYIGISLLALIALIWGLHFVLPAPPPEPAVPGLPPAVAPFPR